MRISAGSTLAGLSRRRLLALAGLAVAGAVKRAAAASPAEPEPMPAPRGGIPGRSGIAVAVVLGEHNTLIDVAGPWEVLSSGGYSGGPFDVYSVAASRAPVLCDDGRGAMDPRMGSFPLSGLSVVPDFRFEDAPTPRVVIIGAQTSGEARERKTLEWIRHAAGTADLTASVCTGAYLLAKSGLLDGRPATTNRSAYDDFEKSFPKIRLVRGVRFVESGSVATATGLTAGIDLALHIVERFYGPKVAQDVSDYEEWPGRAWRAG